MSAPLLWTLGAIVGYRGFLILTMLSMWNPGPLVVVFCADTLAYGALGVRSLLRAHRAYRDGKLPGRSPSPVILLVWLTLTSAACLWLMRGGFPAMMHTSVLARIGEFNWVVAAAAFACRFAAEWWAEGRLDESQQLRADAHATRDTLIRLLIPWLPTLYMVVWFVVMVGAVIATDSPSTAASRVLDSQIWLIPVLTVGLQGAIELRVAWRRQR